MLVFYTDTDCDITLKEVEKYGIKLISMPYTVDNVDYYPYESFKEFNSKEYYDILRSKKIPKTFALNEYNYENIFEEDFKNGNDIIYFHFSRAMTTSFNSMDIAIETLHKKYPGTKFYSVDTKGITALSYSIIIEALEMYKNGATAEELVKWADTEVQKHAIFFYVDNLSFFKLSGRVSGIAAFFGNMINLHPILHMSKEGKMESMDKVRGTKKAYSRIIELVDEYQEDIKKHPVIVAHTDNEPIANELKQALIDKYGNDLDIRMFAVNPTAGAHSGPDGVSISFHSSCRYPK